MLTRKERPPGQIREYTPGWFRDGFLLILERMSGDSTIPQGDPERLRSQQMSLQRGCPPAQVPGYELERFLGVGAFGEVWVAIERNTGRRVAIKFYAHRGGLDWSLLSREVEKLAFLFADRYVVQLIGVGWDANPPYYIMEYLERGSLAERLQQGSLPAAEAVEIFHDVAVGLAHAHGKGVLHCDLKPANVLLDQDSKPRLADFGQSRLSHEQVPALGTLFYMAPEQAELTALPDARWDVYALGALLYCMLTGQPPYRIYPGAEDLDRETDLNQRLAQYRRLLRRAPPPAEHRKVRGVDRALAEIIDGCLAVNPEKRFPNVQAVLEALRLRAIRRERRPMMVVGAVGPVVLLAVLAMFAWWGFSDMLQRSEEAIVLRALESNQFAARYVARDAATALETRWRAIEQVADSGYIEGVLSETTADEGFLKLLEQLSDPQASEEQLEPLRRKFLENPKRKQIQQEFTDVVLGRSRPKVGGWFLTDARGIQVARVPESDDTGMIGKNFSWRPYFHGHPQPKPKTWRPRSSEHIQDTFLSPVYRNDGSTEWMVALTCPVINENADDEFLGVAGLVMEIGKVAEFEGMDRQFAVLVDMRKGENQGVILQHPLLDRLQRELGGVPPRFQDYRIRELPSTPDRVQQYHDPFSETAEGEDLRRQWLAQSQPVVVRERDTGLAVIVQEDFDGSIGQPLRRLRAGLVRYSLGAVAVVVLVIAALWGLAFRLLQEASPQRSLIAGLRPTETAHSSARSTRRAPSVSQPPDEVASDRAQPAAAIPDENSPADTLTIDEADPEKRSS